MQTDKVPVRRRGERLCVKPALLIYYLAGLIGAWLFARGILFKLVRSLRAETAVYSERNRRAVDLLAAIGVLPSSQSSSAQKSAWAALWCRYLLGALGALVVSSVSLSLAG